MLCRRYVDAPPVRPWDRQRFRVVVDVTVDSLRLGQQAEALVDLADPAAGSLGPLPGKGAA